MLLYALTIFTSAFLLFQVQPIIARSILPWFGGSAAVWTACLLFFQLMLLFGYLYSHLVVQFLRPRRQAVLHLGLLLISLVSLPIIPKAHLKPTGVADPTVGVLGLLLLTVGLPYFLVSTTGPLVQAWYAARLAAGSRAIPYRLYALSNLGSMLGLITYPILVEPYLPVKAQAWSWSIGYVLFVLMCGALAAGLFRAPLAEAAPSPAEVVDEQKEDDPTLGGPEPKRAPGIGDLLFWLALSSCSSSLLLSVTTHLTQNIAAIPFLWVIPLSLYLLSFIICFGPRQWAWQSWFRPLPFLAIGSLAFFSTDQFKHAESVILIPMFSMGLFVCCVLCHGELARTRPASKYLTVFYLLMSVGGAVGGLFNAIVAPLIFTSHYELEVSIGACAALTLISFYGEGLRPWAASFLVAAALVVGGWAGLLATGTMEELDEFNIQSLSKLHPIVLWALGALFLAQIVAFWILVYDAGIKWKRGAWIALSGLTGLALGYLVGDAKAIAHEFRLSSRNFYGALHVRDMGSGTETRRVLINGTINHGHQLLDPERTLEPVGYYVHSSGIGRALRFMHDRGPNNRVGVIGLGSGTLACYGRKGDYYRFYELNPEVEKVARSEFKFLSDTPAKTEVVLGDARLSMEREEPQNLDLLAVDAFSSDAIPVHLLTREAFEIYFRHLKSDGMLVVHVSNRYLDLKPVVLNSASALGKTARLIYTDDEAEEGAAYSDWILVTSQPQVFNDGYFSEAAEPIEPQPGLRTWTDDYSNLFQIMK
jgi:SAM-dependent methyltransferase